jgi:hypothetical protein
MYIVAMFCPMPIGVVVSIVVLIFARIAHLSLTENRAAYLMAILALLSPLAVPLLAVVLVILGFFFGEWR